MVDSPRGPRWRAALALGGTLVLVILSASILTPPRNMRHYQLVVGATEYSPFVVLLDLLWCLAVNRLLVSHRGLRGAVIVLLVACAGVAVVPLTQFTQTAAMASGQLGTEESQARFSLVTALRGLPSSPRVAERVVPYAASDGSRLTMRVYAEPSAVLQPAVVVLYAGGWRGGDASQCESMSRALASRGFVVAAIDYRHAPQFHFPAQLQDVRASLKLVRDSAASWHIDANRMAVLGRSSGGHLAELTAFSPGDVPVRAVVAMYAPYDLVEGYRDVPSPDPIGVQAILTNFIGGTPATMDAAYKAASPSSYVHAGLPPTLYVIAGKDHIVKPEFNERAVREMRRAHVPVVSVEIPWAEHGFDMAPSGLGAQLAFAVISSFLGRELKH